MTVFCPAGHDICKDDSCLTLVELHHSKFPAPAVQGSTSLVGAIFDGCPQIQDNWKPIWLDPHLRLIMSSVLRVTSRFMANHKCRSFNFPSLSSHLQSQVYPLVISQFATEGNDFQVREQNHNRTEPCFSLCGFIHSFIHFHPWQSGMTGGYGGGSSRFLSLVTTVTSWKYIDESAKQFWTYFYNFDYQSGFDVHPWRLGLRTG